MREDCMPCGRADGEDGTETPKRKTPKCRVGPKDAAEAGTYRMSFTDQQLRTRVRVLKVVIAYLTARGDSKIVVDRLHMELRQFRDYLWKRQSYT